MSKEIVDHRKIEDLEDLQDALDALHPGGHPSLIKFTNPFFLILETETLTDGSEVYNMRITPV